MAEVFHSDDESMEVVSTETEEESEQMAVTILMTNEQRLAVQFFFGHNGWEYTETDRSVREQDYEDEHLEPGYVIPQDSAAEECIHCLCRPCITSDCNQQMWWETDNQPPHERNATIRKGIYKRFWTMLFHRRVWRDPRVFSEERGNSVSRRQQAVLCMGWRQASQAWYNAWLCTETCEVLVPQPSDNAVYGTQMGIELHLISTEIDTLHT